MMPLSSKQYDGPGLLFVKEVLYSTLEGRKRDTGFLPPRPEPNTTMIEAQWR